MRTATDVVCPFCGTLCDDLEVDIDDDEKISRHEMRASSATISL